jgi:large subunit ribosomal protein L33
MMTIGSVRPSRRAGDAVVGGVIASGALEADVPQKTAKSFERRRRIVLSCAACGGRNYRKTKARREGAAPLQLKKFCSICNAHTQHREAV